MTQLQLKVIEWLARGETGTSSMTMAFYLGFGVKYRHASYPLDPADFDRCLRLLARVPELRKRLRRMEVFGKEWAALAKQWSEVEACHLDEVGIGWTKARSAPRTYDLMQIVLYGKRRSPGLHVNISE